MGKLNYNHESDDDQMEIEEAPETAVLSKKTKMISKRGRAAPETL
jgi:hypothetical protein